MAERSPTPDAVRVARSRVVVATSVVLAVVLCLLSLVGWVGINRLRHSIDAVTDSTDRVTAYQGVQRAIAKEVEAEAGYRRAPGALTRERVLAALTAVDAAAGQVREAGGPSDDAAMTYLLVLNSRYATELRTELAGKEPRASETDPVAGPSLVAMQELVDAAVGRTTRELYAANDAQRSLVTRMAWRAPLALLLVVAAVALCWCLLIAFSRRAQVRADVSEQLAMRDSLTGLENRRSFERLLAPELAKDSPDSAVLLLDLDGFKAINDTWGHDVGDQVLITIGERLRSTVRGSDVVARIGGDEFAVLARPAQHAETLVSRLSEAVAKPMPVSGVLLHLTASIGWAPVVPGATQTDLLRQADVGLYDVKRSRTPGRRLGERRISH